MLSGQKRSKRGVGKIEDPASALAISILALLLVTYVPTIYQAYTSREAFLTSFETIAGDPPNVTAMIIRSHELASLDRLSVIWIGWREWFAELRESHTALPAVPFLGSSRNDRNWVATVGTFVLAACSVAGGARSRERFDCFAGQRGAVALAALTASLTTQLPSCGTYGSIA